jgi:polysaccharide export outer membrane protein
VNLLIDWLPTDGWPRFVADAVWQSTLAGLLGVACIRWIARRPATRACVSVCAIVAAVALPLITAGVRVAGWGVLGAATVVPLTEAQKTSPVAKVSHGQARMYLPTTSSEQVGSHAGRTIAESSGLAGIDPMPAQSIGQDSSPHSAVTYFLALWCIVSVVLLLRLLASAWQARRLLHEAVPSDDAVVAATVQSAASRLRIAVPPVLVSPKVNLPTVFAFGRGVLLLPGESASADANAEVAETGRSSAYNRWFAIFCHELGHIRRRDGRNRLAVELALTLLPWQPLLWLLRREFLRHSEEACDDWAVASGVDPIDFAAVLADFVPSVPRLNLGATIMSADAKSRILRLLALHETPRPRTTWPQLIALAAASCAIVGSAALAQRPAAEKGRRPDTSEAKAVNQSLDTKSRAGASPDARPVYVLEPPDIVLIEPIRLLPKGPERIERLDQLNIEVAGALPDAPIEGVFKVDADGEVSLGPHYGRVHVAGLTIKETIQKIDEHVRKTLRDPEVAVSMAEKRKNQQVGGTHLIGPDGHLNLGTFGGVYVAGMTIEEARQAIEKTLGEHFEKPSIAVTVTAYNSKVFYVIVEGREKGDSIHRFPMTGNDTVFDALAQVNATIRKDMKIWISRPSAEGAFQQIPVDWARLKSGEDSARRYQLQPGDRVFLQ